MPGTTGGIVAPPFMQKPAAAAPAVDPFQAAAAAPRERKVTLVVDDSAIHSGKAAKRAGARNRALLIGGFVAGVALGVFMGMSSSENKITSLASQDSKAVDDTLAKAAKPVAEASGYVQKLLADSNSSAQAKIDYASIEKLVAIKKPLAPNPFHRRFFSNFEAEAVDDLFRYANNVEALWAKFTLLGAKTAARDKREYLDKVAASGGKNLDVRYGMVPRVLDEMVLGGLVFLNDSPVTETGEKKTKSKAPPPQEVEAASRLGGMSVKKRLYTGQSDFIEDPGAYSFMLDKKANQETLGDPPNLFQDYRKDIAEMGALMKQTMEIQGRLAEHAKK